ncbi:MAG: hypothetical protein FWC17_01930 [Treponema sp.]|nr:hypothetical protein [Treponema sp.]
MRNKVSVFFIFTVVLAVLLVSSCGTTSANLLLDYGHRGNTFGLQVITPAKDFNGLGLVFTEQSFEFNPDEYFRGDTFTYQALLKEAKALGADAIINVVIDYRQVIRSDTVDTETKTTRNETWYGSALAIKYTTTLVNSSTTTTNQQEWIVTSSTASQTPILNGVSTQSSSSTAADSAPVSSPAADSTPASSSNTISTPSGSSSNSSVGIFGSLFGR